MNRISEFSSHADGLAKRPREVFTSKQRLMHGSEISREVREVREIHSESVAKPAEKKKRRSFKDAVKMLAGGAAAVAVVAVSATAAAPVEEQPETAPTLAPYTENEKYSYSVLMPTYRETLEPGGYAVVLDVSTEEKKQAFYKYFADSVFEILRLDEEKGEEFRNEPESNRYVWTTWRSETENGGSMSSYGKVYSFEDDNFVWAINTIASGYVLGYPRTDTEIAGYVDTLYNPSMSSRFSDELLSSMEFNNFTAMKQAYGGLTSEEILGLMTEPLDNYFFEVKKAGDGTQWKNIRYETMSTLEQFTITQGKADIVMPVFFKVVRDDELYGWQTLTVPEGGNYFLVTGSDEYPADKPYGSSFNIFRLEERAINKFRADYFTYDWAEGTHRISFPTTSHAHKNMTWFYPDAMDGSLTLTDFIYGQNLDEPQTGSNHIYYELVTLRAVEGANIQVPQLSRLIPIEDKYYLYTLGYTTTYTITNNGDHEVVVIGNLFCFEEEGLSSDKIASANSRYNDGAMGQFFNYEPLMPGESLTIYSNSIASGVSGVATLTMPECCTVVDSSGNGYSHTGTEIDLLKGTTKED